MRRTAPFAILTLTLAAALVGCSDGANDEASPTTTVEHTGCGRAAVAAPGTERLTTRRGDVDREYERVIPPTYDGTTPHPLIVNLHGATSTIEQQDLFSGLPEAAATRGYILLTPQAAPATLVIGGEELEAPFWNITPEVSATIPGAQDDVAFLTELIDTTASELCVDDARIYVTGNSNGAGMSAVLACAMPGRLAAIAPVSGINLAPACDQLEPLSVIAFHGDADPLVPYEGGSAARTELGNPSVEARVDEFAQAAQCAADPRQSSPYDDITLREWTDCRTGIDVELYTVLGGGHTWPGMLNYVDAAKLAEIAGNQRLVELAGVDLASVAGHMTVNLEATATMLDFFDAHRRP